jgi:hypothetical protein
MKTGAYIAGLLLVAMSVLDLVLGGGAPGVVHVTVAVFGLVLLAVASAVHDAVAFGKEES